MHKVKQENLQKNAIIIPFADTIIALLSGMAVMPACAAFGVDYARGPGLLFVSMQTVFENMGSFGNFVGFMFYFLVAALVLFTVMGLPHANIGSYFGNELFGAPLFANGLSGLIEAASYLTYATGGATVILAMGAGKNAAKEILKMFNK